ncbi:sensor histidine kinase [Thiocystis violascens]|uniref:histidine kinase n=1 Tax=Thiocystis violascens (strain ATCC 17096 / DSM 198 / 6111) TaxID=765911 RepID=I3YAP3_THIV6|nr:sensor histidine kinase [Thiocystis violascens]AFL74061.1 Na+/proline symporter [Thiocystis violascens DSM 198]
MTGPLIVGASFAYLGLLFAIAYWADRRADRGRPVIARPTVYALSLAVYCTAWTFYGSVGRAADSGLGFLPIYLGPTLIALLWGSLLLKMVRVSKSERITSIADFIASRYGKSQALAGLVTVIAVIGVVPYIALQLKAIAWSFTILQHYPEVRMPDHTALPLWRDTAFVVALLLAAFTILFGTRQLDASERHEGMVAAIAFESIVKLVAFLAVGLFVTLGFLGLGGPELPNIEDNEPLAALLKPLLEPSLAPFQDWFAISLLAGLAVMLLPRQFQVAVVEISDERHLRRAIWLFPLYLLLINLFVIPIAIAGLTTFPDGRVDADTFMLTLPIAFAQPWLALLVFLGGLSAATGMVIVETIALSTMVSNDLVLPALMRHWRRQPPAADLGRLLLDIRRGAIVLILLLGYLYYHFAGEAYALVSIGLISFVAVAQFAPAVIGGLYWRGGTREGALAGLLAGFLVWIYTLLLPSFARSDWLPPAFMDSGPGGMDLLAPLALFGLVGWNEITHGLFWSLTANLGVFLLVSSLREPNAVETTQARIFVDALRQRHPTSLPLWRGRAEIAELMALTERFLGVARTRDAFARHARARGIADPARLPADAETVAFAETLLSGAIGGASARVMVASVTEEEALGLDEVLDILDEASQIRAYSHELEQKSQALEAATADLRAANLSLTELDRMKDDFISSVTHELRTPLASIRAFSEILFDDPRLDLAQRKRFLGILVSETERLSRLVNQVLDLAKIESGHADWRTEAVTLQEVIEQAVTATGQLVEDRGIQVRLDLPAQPALVWGDRDRLIQVLVNLLSNAAKFAPAGSGRLEVRLSQSTGRGTDPGDPTWRVCVSDNGPGIPPDELELVFEKFRQATIDGAKPLGTGLGLPISRQIVENLGGHIWAENAPQKGANLCFELPAHPVDSFDHKAPL